MNEYLYTYGWVKSQELNVDRVLGVTILVHPYENFRNNAGTHMQRCLPYAIRIQDILRRTLYARYL